MAREGDVYGIGTTLLTVGIGGSLALLVVPRAQEVSSVLKYFTGGSLELVHALEYNTPQNPGATNWNGASLANMQGRGYLLATNEVMNFSGAARYYLIATGATAQAYLLVGLGQGA